METQFENCSTFNYHQLKMLNLTMCLTGAGGMLVAGLAFTVLLCVRAYKTVLQRLFLYGVLSTFIHEATHFANMEHQFQYRPQIQKQVCEHLGFLVNWTTWIVCNFHICIVAYLLFVVFTQVRGDPFPILAHLKPVKRALEATCVFLSVFLPVTVLWVPYLSHEYGLDESWCWMRAFDDRNCTSVGLSYKLIYGYSYFEAVGLIALLTAVGITIVYCRLATRFSDAKQLLRQVMILVLSVVAFMIILNIMLGIDALGGSKSSYTRQIFFSAAATINDLVFLGGYIFTFYFPKCPSCIKRKGTLQGREVEEKNEKDYGTFGPSDRVSALSNTEFHVQYTGEFTSISHDRNLIEN